MATVFSATMVEFHRGGQVMLYTYKRYKDPQRERRGNVLEMQASQGSVQRKSYIYICCTAKTLGLL